MENSLWTFGCSFTAEYHPLDNTPPNNYDLYKIWKGGTLPDVWPTILSKKLNLQNKNKGRGAISNYRIFYNFCDTCSQLQENDVVLIQWTSIYRFLYGHPEHYLTDILPAANYGKDEYDVDTIEGILVNRMNSVWIQEIIHFTKIINEICKEKKVKLFYWTYDEEDIWSYMSSFWEDYSKLNIIHAPNGNDLLSYLGLVTDETHTIWMETDNEVKDAHLGEIGHTTQAEYFYNFIKNKI